MQLAALIKSFDDPVYRYRIRAFEPDLRRRGWEISLHCLPRKWPMRLPLYPKLRAADGVLLQRRLLGWGELFALRRSARWLVYDFDDAVLYRSSNSLKGPHSFKRGKRLGAKVRAADAVIAGNGFLADLACRYTDPKKVRLIPTCVDPMAYQPAKHQQDQHSLRIVWIGSFSTVRSLHGISEQLKAVSRAVPESRLKLICDVFPEGLPITVDRCPWSSEHEAEELASADIGISFMPDGVWSQGKCGLKVLQYMAAGLPVVANPVGVHREMVVHGKNGFLVQTPEEWAEAVRSLARDPELRRAMGNAGRKAVFEGYSPGRWADLFTNVVLGGEKI